MYWLTLYITALAWASSVSAIDCTGIKAVSPQCSSAESAYTRDTFFVGGEYIPYNGTYQSIYSDQLYVEKLTPVGGVSQKNPLVFISAGVPTGAVWLNTPDNRKGWASFFLDAGYLVYIVDIVANGRSSQNNIPAYPARIGSTDNITQNDFTAPQLIDPYPQSLGHNKWPGTGVRGDPYFDAFEASIDPLTSNLTSQELAMRASGCTLLSLIGGAYTICHSAGCIYTSLMSDQCPELLRASINLEAGNTPFQNLIGNATVPAVGYSPARPWGLTDTPITYDPPITSPSELSIVEVGPDLPGNRSCYVQASNSTIHTLPQIAKVPYVLFTAANSPHITYDHCLVTYLQQVGVPNVDWILLGDLNITGNGHFFYLELNNLEIAQVVHQKIQQLDAGTWRPRGRQISKYS